MTDGDARPGGVVTEIPGHASIQAGDLIVLLWNGYVSPPSVVVAAEIGKDPLKTFVAPYDVVYADWFAAAGDADRNVPATVSYRIEREGVSLGEPTPPATVLANLFGAGGKDPAPDTPAHENLRPPVVQAGGGGPPNVIPADAIDRDAIATLPGLNAGTPASAAFRPGDRVQLYWEGQPIDDPFTVVMAEADVVRRIPAAVLSAHGPGTWAVYYTAARALATLPFVNSAASPVQGVDIKDRGDLPGGGLLLRGKWVEGPTEPDRPEHIDYPKALSGGGTPVRIYGYANMAAGDIVAAEFRGYDDLNPPDGQLVPESPYTHTLTIQSGDLVPRPDETVQPPVDAVFIDILVPTANLLPIIYGSATFDYRVTNGAGTVHAVQSSIYVSVRPPGQDQGA